MSITVEDRNRIIEALADELGTFGEVARAVGISRESLYNWRKGAGMKRLSAKALLELADRYKIARTLPGKVKHRSKTKHLPAQIGTGGGESETPVDAVATGVEVEPTTGFEPATC